MVPTLAAPPPKSAGSTTTTGVIEATVAILMFAATVAIRSTSPTVTLNQPAAQVAAVDRNSNQPRRQLPVTTRIFKPPPSLQQIFPLLPFFPTSNQTLIFVNVVSLFVIYLTKFQFYMISMTMLPFCLTVLPTDFDSCRISR